MKEAIEISHDLESPKGLRLMLFWLMLVVVILLVTLVILGETPADRAIKWFGRLGFPDTQGCKYVRVATGSSFSSGDNPPENSYIEGFLLSQSNGTFTVLTKDLFVRTFTNTPAATPAHQQVSFEVLNLRAEADACLRRLKNPPKDSWPRLGRQLRERAEIFVLAWGCSRNGESARARQLVERASAICEVAKTTNRLQRLFEPVRRRLKLPARRLGMIEQLERDIGDAMMWRAVENFGDPSVSRPELLAQFGAIVTNYPGSEHRARAEQTVERLTAMIAQDTNHPDLTTAEFEQLGLEERISELIYRLRDQNSRQYSQPGWSDIFMDLHESTNNPAHELVRIGYPAVPKLIVALDDRTFTRSVGSHRTFHFSDTVLTVGDCAASILQRISGKSFAQPHATWPYTSNAVSGTRQVAETWWAEFQKKGERQMLIDSVSSGDGDAPAQGRLLIERYPAEATDAIVRGSQASTNDWIRVQLVEILAEQTNKAAIAFLQQELIEGPILKARVAAAFGLRSKGHREAVMAMIREWDQLKEEDSDELNGLEELIQFLAGLDSLDAIAALRRNLSSRPVATRLAVIEKLGEGSWPFEERDERLSPATLNAVEEVLISALQDKEEYTGMSGSYDGKNFSDPRVCDLAAHALTKRWPDRYEFDLSGSLKTQDRQIVQCQNVWRRASGMKELPLPTRPSIHVRPEDAVRIAAVEWEENSAKPSAALVAVAARMKDKHLTPTGLVQLLIAIAKAPASSGFALKAIKDDDLTGVRLVISLLPGAPPSEEQGFDENLRVTLGTDSLYSSSGGGSLEHYESKLGWDDFAEAAGKALAGPAEKPFIIKVRIAASKQ